MSTTYQDGYLAGQADQRATQLQVITNVVAPRYGVAIPCECDKPLCQAINAIAYTIQHSTVVEDLGSGDD